MKFSDEEYRISKMKYVVVLVAFTLFSCADEPSATVYQMTEFELCLGAGLNQFFEESEVSLDNYLKEKYGEGDQTSLQLRYLEAWKEDQTGKIFSSLQEELDSNLQTILFQRPVIREVVDWSLNFGDSLWITSPRPGGRTEVFNEIRFNHKGGLQACLSSSSDSLAIAYLYLKDGLDIKYGLMAGFLLQQAQREGLDRDLWRKLIVVELYIRPLAHKYMEQ